jgi:hypothetical protein
LGWGGVHPQIVFSFFFQKEQFDWPITNTFETWDTPQDRNLNMLPLPIPLFSSPILQVIYMKVEPKHNNMG